MPQKKGVKQKETDSSPDAAEEEGAPERRESPEACARRWKKEFEAAEGEQKTWHKNAKDTLARYLDDRKGEKTDEKRTNLFTCNVVNQEAQLYGKTPQTDVTRKYHDPDDDIARVAGTMLQRILNGDIERPDDKFAAIAGHALSDFLRVDFGLLRWRYDMKERPVPAQPAVHRPDPVTGKMVEAAPAVPAHTEKTWEDVVPEYCYWGDVRWSPCRIYEELRWIAFRTQMRRKELKKHFKEEGGRIGLKSKGYDGDSNSRSEEDPRFPWDRADVWEIWSKEDGKVYWYVEGHDRILRVEDDPLELEDFWPCPKPMVMWFTTTRFLPKPEYLIAQDSYMAVERLTTRIDVLVGALRAIGIYDENVKELQTLLDDSDENVMVPVPNWASLVNEKGGLEGVVSWFPLTHIVEVLEQLREQRQQEIELNYQITGTPDVMRGDIQDPSETATATRTKTRSASVRVRRKQEIFAKFVSDAQRIRAEIIAKRFDDETLIARSNITNTDDQEFVEDAIKLLREDAASGFRITVKPEAVSMDDFAEMKQERTEFVTAVGNFMGMMAKLPPVALPAVPELAETLKWYAAGFRGSTTIEASMDRLVKKLQEVAKNPPQQQGEQPDMSKVEAQKLKNEGDQQRIQLEMQARSQEIQQEAQAKKEEITLQAHFDNQQELQRQHLEASREQAEQMHESHREQVAEAHQAESEERAMHREEAQAQREERNAEADREHALQVERQKAQTATQQLRMKGQQAEKQVKLKAKHQPKPKPGGKK